MNKIAHLIATIDQHKDPKSQAIYNAFRILAQDVSALTSAPSGTADSNGLISNSLFQFQELTYASTITPTLPSSARFLTTRVTMTGNITAFNTPQNIRTGGIYAAIFESDASSRSVTFSSWYAFLTGAPVVIPANSRFIVLMVATDNTTQGRQLSTFLQSTAGGGGGGYTGAPITPPTGAGTWTAVNGISIADSSQSTLVLTKSGAGAGFCLKAIPTPSLYDISGAVTNVNFGNYDASISGTSDNIIIECGFVVTTGTVAGSSSARGLTHYLFPQTVGAGGARQTGGFITRSYASLGSSPAGINSFITLSPFLSPTAPTWFRISGSNTSVNIWVGDGLSWTLAATAVLPANASHFGFYINPTGGLPGTALTQIVRVVSCSV